MPETQGGIVPAPSESTLVLVLRSCSNQMAIENATPLQAVTRAVD